MIVKSLVLFVAVALSCLAEVPRLISKVDPSETAVGKAWKAGGKVVLTVEISPAGVPENVAVKSGINSELDANAVECVKRWRFEPGTKNGVAIRMDAVIEVNYLLRY